MKLISLLFCLIFLVRLNAQPTEFFGGVSPQFTLGFDINEKWSLTHKLESQNFLFQNDEKSFWGYRHFRTDFQTFAEREINPYSDIAVGYMLRINENSAPTHRITQQFSLLDNWRNLRVGYRLRTEQTFTPNQHPEWRVRYRVKPLIPLEGEKADIGEFYLTVSAEWLYSYQHKSDDLELRTELLLGKNINARNKWEWGIDWRTDRYLTSGFRHRFWLVFKWYKNI